jgi:hypothetical protein
MLQNGFVNSGSSLVRIQIGAQLIINLPLSAILLAQSATSRRWSIELFLSNLGGAALRAQGMSRIVNIATAGDAAPLLEERCVNTPGVDFSIANDITLDVQNSQADPALSTGKNFVMVERF